MPEDLKKILARGKRLSSANRPEPAKQLYLEALELFPNEPKLLLALGEVYDCLGYLKEASAVYRQAAEFRPADPEVLYQLCESYLMSYQTEKARQVCGQALALFPRDYRFYMVLADAYLWGISTENKTGLEKAEYLTAGEKALKNCLKLPFNNGEPYFVRAEIALLKGELKKTLAFIQKALKGGLSLYGDYVDLNLALAILDLRMGEKARAKKAINQCLFLLDNWKEATFLKTLLFREHCLMLKELYWAEPFSPKEIEPFNREHLQLLARGFKSQSLSELLRDFFRKIPAYRQKPKAGIKKIAELLGIFSGKLPLCIVFQLIKKPSLYAILKLYQGDFYLALGERESARQCYREALAVNPGDLGAEVRIKKLK